MRDPKEVLVRLHQNLNTLQQREAKYVGNAPVELLNEIEDHRRAIELTERWMAAKISEAEWQEGLRPLLVARGPEGGAVAMGDKFDLSGDFRGAVINIKSSVEGEQTIQRGGDKETTRVATTEAAATTKGQPVIYGVAGLLVGAVVNIALNLLSTGIQQRYFGEQFSAGALGGLAIFAVGGLLAGLWLGGPVTVPTAAATPEGQRAERAKPVTVTRLRALWSYAQLKGQGISLNDILLIGSTIEIDTRSEHDSSHD